MKPRVMVLAVFTALVGLMIAPGHLHPLSGCIAILAIAAGAGAAGILNMWYDADIDCVMARTAMRPIPTMTDTRYDRAPGDSLAGEEGRTSRGLLVHTIGLGLAVILTAMSFGVANTSLLWAHGVPLGLTVLAIAQMGVHLVFFLHITTRPDNTNDVLALAFGSLIVIAARRLEHVLHRLGDIVCATAWRGRALRLSCR
jgi:cytochrome o ubiquinol oxidase subunit IV